MGRYGFISPDIFPALAKIRKPRASALLMASILIHAGADGLVDREILALAVDATGGRVHKRNLGECLAALQRVGLLLEELPGIYRILCPHKAGGWEDVPVLGEA